MLATQVGLLNSAYADRADTKEEVQKADQKVSSDSLSCHASSPQQSKAGAGETKDTVENPPGVKFPPKAIEHESTDQGQS